MVARLHLTNLLESEYIRVNSILSCWYSKVSVGVFPKLLGYIQYALARILDLVCHCQFTLDVIKIKWKLL